MILHKAKGIHLEGKKSMSKKFPIQEYMNPQFVYIHLLQQASTLKRVVEVGETVKIGQIVARREGFGEMPIHASISGKVTAVKKVWHSSGRMVEAIEIENDNLNQVDPSIVPDKNVANLSREELVAKMKESGLSGLGGAGFPTYVKYGSKTPIHTVIINAVECEPYLTCDYALLIKYPEKLLKGLSYLLRASNASKGVITYKKYNQEFKEVLTPFLKEFPNIVLFDVDDIYPAGWEKYLVEQVTKTTYKRLPGEVGVIVDNLATAITYCDVVENNIPLIARAITITGEGMKQPQNFFVPIGTKVSDLVKQAGGYVDGLDSSNTWYIAGGPMTGRAILVDDLIVNDTLGGVIVKPFPEPKEHPNCLGCGKCNDVCPVYLSPTEIENAFNQKDLVAIKKLNAEKCIVCGLCSYVCPSHIEITDYVVRAKELLRKGA
ncbi:MAG: RnfABCDGE type electron transport complex subunit C [Candidatus Izemoplasmatales bacterium]|nr:RnfABCDGE type electron transport complex subunit C [Candidatus Izemoplasmatales bacterium]